MSGFITPEILNLNKNSGDIFLDESQKGIGFTLSMNKKSDESPFIVLDFKRKTTGYIFTESVRATGGAGIKINYGPLTDLMPQGKTLRPESMTGEWTDDEYVACRYMKISLDLENVLDGEMEISVEVSRLALVFSAYPAVWRGSFTSDDRLLDKIWETGAYTVLLCMQKNTQSSTYNPHLPENHKKFIREWKSSYSPYVIFDGPRRDRETWLGDIRTEALVVYSAFAAPEVSMSSLEIFADLQKPSGLAPGCGSTWQEFKEYNLWWVISVWECYLYTGDKDFLDKIRPAISKFMDWLSFHLDERMFLYNDNNWMWTFPREGYSSATQCILYNTLICASFIEKEYGNNQKASEYECMAEITRKNINLIYWDDDRGIYTDELKLTGTRIPVITDVNCYAISFGIAGTDKSKRILDYLRKNMWTEYGSTTTDYKIEKASLSEDANAYPIAGFIRSANDPEKAIVEFMYPHNRMIWPFMVAYEVQARFEARDIEGAFELTRNCWGNMTDEPPGTFWECVDSDTGSFPRRTFFPGSKHDSFNSAAHGWSGWISHIMQSCILGVKPIKPGYKKTVITPLTGDLKKVSGKMPTPFGDIEVKIKKDDKKYDIRVICPEPIDCIIEIEDQEKGKRKVSTGIKKIKRRGK